jgi:hypothetical protein
MDGIGGIVTGEWASDSAPPKNDDGEVEWLGSPVFGPGFCWELAAAMISFHPEVSPDASVLWETGREYRGTGSICPLFHGSPVDPDTDMG